MRRFEYFEPKTVEETVSILAQYGDNAKILAGGTILVPEIKSGNLRPDCVINIKTIEGLSDET
jgi:CO/xanthine dehydrogenase FAD-binding subunit